MSGKRIGRSPSVITHRVLMAKAAVPFSTLLSLLARELLNSSFYQILPLRDPKVRGLIQRRLLERQVGNQPLNNAADAWGEAFAHNDAVRIAAQFFAKFSVS